MTDRETLRRLIVGEGETRIDGYEAADRVLAWLIQRLPSRAWEMGRDAAAERIDPASDLADHELTEWGMTRREAANQARALTPPATLARPEPNETQRGPAGNDPDRPGGGSTSSGERRASVSPRPDDEWQPIDTAPKDGTPILAMEEGGDMFRAEWSDDSDSWLTRCGQPAVYSPDPAWWMPLPALPRAALTAA